MNTLKTIYRTCDCGKLNEVYNAYTIHNRVSCCNICQSTAIKRGRTLEMMESLAKNDWINYEFEKFAIAWGA